VAPIITIGQNQAMLYGYDLKNGINQAVLIDLNKMVQKPLSF